MSTTICLNESRLDTIEPEKQLAKGLNQFIISEKENFDPNYQSIQDNAKLKKPKISVATT
jgi:hypothetical protein